MADLLAGVLHCLGVLVVQPVDLFAIEMAEAVHDHHRARRCGCDRFENLPDLLLGDVRHGHQVGHCLVALLASVVEHVHRLGHLVGVKRDADHTQHAVGGRREGGLPIALAGIGHGRKRQPGALGVMVADDPPHVLFVAVPPRTESVLRKQPLRVLVADLHRIHARRDARVVHRADEFVAELVVVDQAPVADCAIQYLQLGAVRDPRGLLVRTIVTAHDVLVLVASRQNWIRCPVWGSGVTSSFS